MIPVKANPREPSTIAAAISSVDQRIQRCIQELWVLLPEGRRTPEDLEAQFRRLSDRALEQFVADYRQFPGTEGGETSRSGS